jgi:uncharacterized protein GlcG (DUF336 family)
MSLTEKPKSTAHISGQEQRRSRRLAPSCDSLETRELLSTIKTGPVPAPNPADPFNSAAYAVTQYVNGVGNTTDPYATTEGKAKDIASQLTPYEVEQLLNRASAASPSQDAIIAIVDRGGKVLGVRAESGVSPTILNNPQSLTYAVDGALALARTGAFFGNDQAPLTSRTVQTLSESTMLQQEVNSNPSITDKSSTLSGPGTVAAIGIKGHFPAGVPFTPQVDLFQIEKTNRDTTVVPSTGQVRPSRFNVATQFVPQYVKDVGGLAPPDSYGYISGISPSSLPRGIGTLPGGLPIERTVKLKGQIKSLQIGGIGVFYPGTTGSALEENSVTNQNFYDPNKPDRAQEAEAVAFAALGGASDAKIITGVPTTVGTIDNVAPVPGLDLLPIPNNKTAAKYQGRIDLVGLTLDVFGPHGNQGPITLLNNVKFFKIGTGTVNGTDLPIAPGQTAHPFVPTPAAAPPVATPNTNSGVIVPSGWVVTPHDGGGITAADVIQMVANGLIRAQITRAAIRLPISQPSRFIFAVTDLQGNVLGLYRTPDATIFSLDVAVAKARNVAYYNDPTQLQAADQTPGVKPGTAFTARTFRYLALPHFPEGIDVYPSGPFSILNNNQVTSPSIPANQYTSVQGYDSFNPQTNFKAKTDPANQNGIIFFPGSSGVYKNINGRSTLVGGLGISGDGVDQDDVATYAASLGFRAPNLIQADHAKVRGVRIPYMKFNRNPQL